MNTPFFEYENKRVRGFDLLIEYEEEMRFHVYFDLLDLSAGELIEDGLFVAAAPYAWTWPVMVQPRYW